MRAGGGGAALAGDGGAICEGLGGGGGGGARVRLLLLGDVTGGVIFRGGTAGTARETDGDGFNGDWARGGIAGLGRAGGLELLKTGGGARRGGNGAEGVLKERFLDGNVGAGRAGGAGAVGFGGGWAGTATGGFGGALLGESLLGESPLGTEGGLPKVGGFPTSFRISQDDAPSAPSHTKIALTCGF